MNYLHKENTYQISKCKKSKNVSNSSANDYHMRPSVSGGFGEVANFRVGMQTEDVRLVSQWQALDVL